MKDGILQGMVRRDTTLPCTVLLHQLHNQTDIVKTSRYRHPACAFISSPERPAVAGPLLYVCSLGEIIVAATFFVS
jgi:hypothetical protein